MIHSTDEQQQEQLEDMLKEFKARSKTTVMLETGFYMLVLLLLFAGNFMTLLVMFLYRRMRTIPNMFVASLAVSDLLFGVLLALPLDIPTLVTSQWPFNDLTCQFQGYTATILTVASIHTLVLMAVNRYFRIVKPEKYHRYFTKTKTMMMIVVSWASSMIAPFPYFLSGGKMVFHPYNFVCSPPVNNSAFLGYGLLLYIGFPSCIMFYCYTMIFKTVRRHNYKFQLPGMRFRSVNVQEIKIARTLFVVVVSFNLCWISVLLINLVDTIRRSWVFSREVYVTLHFLIALSSALNPLIYSVLNRNFRECYMKVLSCRYCCCSKRAVVKPKGNASVVHTRREAFALGLRGTRS